MKPNRSYLFIAISSLALLMVLIIQVNWIFRAAKIKEELFNEKADLVLAKTTDALHSDQKTYQKIETCAEMNNTPGPVTLLGKNEIHKIDSLLIQSMKFYGFHVDYSFEVIKSIPIPMLSANTLKNNSSTGQPACGQVGLEEAVRHNGFELKLFFPGKQEYILAEMGTPFVTSIVLILIVLIMFWRTVRSLIIEKTISEHTNDFLNNMTHEFKTPLTNIALAGKMIIKDQNRGQEDKTKHYSGIILEENEKLRLQVEQVLSMTALERGEIPLQKTELDLHQLIADALKYIGIQVEHKEGNLSLNLDADRFVVMGDRTHLTNAVCNLVDNAIKYSQEKPDISVRTSNVGGNLVVAISDKGIGIEKEYQKKVFDKFFRVPTGDVHNVKGFGLGLAYVKKIIELHRGTIDVQSERARLPDGQGKGTTFILTIPYA
jgi:two-component system phosphate regulon sensor histidine kinase PhoR